MRALNIRDVPEAVFRELKAQAAKKGVTLREFALAILAKRLGVDEEIITGENRESGETKAPSPAKKEAARGRVEVVVPSDVVQREVVSSPREDRSHDMKECTVYGCLMCKAQGKKF